MKQRTGFVDLDAQTVASQGNAILGIRDSGKSYTAIKIAELFFEAGIPFVAFDPIGRWRFMRVPGSGRGYPVVVAGGKAGDLPLTVESAPRIMRAAMGAGVSLIFDLYDMAISKADWKRIVGDSIRVLLFENEYLRHIFIEEAAEFVPQRVGPDQGKVYAEVERLARMGGNARLGYTLVNQRAEEVNKAVLELCDNLYLHRQKGRNSLNALTKWLNLADVKPGSREIIQSLPMLPQGQCWAWMAGSDRPLRIIVPQKNSFEPDRRAMQGNVAVVAKKAVDVATFVADMQSILAGKAPRKPTAPTIEAAKSNRKPEDNDVKESEARALRAANKELTERNAELDRRIRRLEAAQSSGAQEPEAPEPVTFTGSSFDEDMIKALVARLSKEPAFIRVTQSVNEIEVRRERSPIKMDAASQPGSIAILISEGFFTAIKTTGDVITELKRRGRPVHPANVSRDLGNIAEKGFLFREEGGFREVAGMKINIVED